MIGCVQPSLAIQNRYVDACDQVHVNLGKYRIDREPTRRIKRLFYFCETVYIPNILFKRSDLNINDIHNEGVHGFLSKHLLKFKLWLKFPNVVLRNDPRGS